MGNVERVARAIWLAAKKEADTLGRNDIPEASFDDMEEAEQNFARRMAEVAISAIQPDVMREALVECRDKFAEYAELHRAKIGTKDAATPAKMDAVLEKVERNLEMMRLCDAALSSNGESKSG